MIKFFFGGWGSSLVDDMVYFIKIVFPLSVYNEYKVLHTQTVTRKKFCLNYRKSPFLLDLRDWILSKTFNNSSMCSFARHTTDESVIYVHRTKFIFETDRIKRKKT